jgi:methyl-accepting chemotaxis protein
MDIIRTLGGDFYPTGNKVEIKALGKRYIADEIKLGENVLVTYNNDFVDNISQRTNTSVSFFQNVNDEFIRVSTTIKNYDETRAFGTIIPADSEVYRAIINKESFYGRIFIVNSWYISIYEPVIDNTGNIVGIMNLAIPEEMEEMSEEPEDSIKKEKILTA